MPTNLIRRLGSRTEGVDPDDLPDEDQATVEEEEPETEPQHIEGHTDPAEDFVAAVGGHLDSGEDSVPETPQGRSESFLLSYDGTSRGGKHRYVRLDDSPKVLVYEDEEEGESLGITIHYRG